MDLADTKFFSTMLVLFKLLIDWASVLFSFLFFFSSFSLLFSSCFDIQFPHPVICLDCVRFLTKGGAIILATWLSQAAAEEQTSLLHVILEVSGAHLYVSYLERSLSNM